MTERGEKSLSPAERLKIALIIDDQLRLVDELLNDDHMRQSILEYINSGLSDVAIAESLGLSDPQKIAAALRTYRWFKKGFPGRSPQTDDQNRLTAGRAWREAHQDLHLAHQKLASQAAAAKLEGVPVKYSAEILEIINNLLNEGLTYEQVAARLNELGFIKVNGNQIKHAVRQWNLEGSQTLSLEAARMKEIQKNVEELAGQGLNRRQIRELLPEYSHGQIDRVLLVLGLRLERFDWQKTKIGEKTLSEIATECYLIAGSIQAGLILFNNRIIENGLKPVTINAYKAVIARNKNTN